jgi:hypothetical protein
MRHSADCVLPDVDRQQAICNIALYSDSYLDPCQQLQGDVFRTEMRNNHVAELIEAIEPYQYDHIRSAQA